jgi:ParB-like nuclease domain
MSPKNSQAELKIELWPIDRLKPYPKNARKWTPQAVEKVAASLREFGFRQPIVVDSEDVIVIGHLRHASARFAGFAEVPVHVANDLTPDQIKALRIADNRTHEEAQWDMSTLADDFLDLKIAKFDVGLTGFDIGEIVENVFGKKSKRTAQTSGDELQFKVVIDCSSEAHQTQLIARFKGEQLKCRALIS